MTRPPPLRRQPEAAAADQRGFALLIVLWSVALLSLLGSTITAAGRTEARIAADLLTSARAQAAADGAVSVAAFHLMAAAAERWAPDGVPHIVVIGDSTVTLAVEDERGRIDVNNVPPGLVAALLRRVGVAGADAATLANAITDWRSPGDTGLAAQYAALHRAYAPPHAPFETLDELGLVLGVTPAIVAQVKPHLSLYLEQQPQTGLADPVVAGAMADLAKTGANAEPPEDEGTLVARVTAIGRSGGASFRRVAVVRIAASDGGPYQVLEWNGG